MSNNVSCFLTQNSRSEGLTEYSGVDVWKFYSEKELEYIRLYYSPDATTKQFIKLTSAIPSQKKAYLGPAMWKDAEVRWEEQWAWVKGSHCMFVTAPLMPLGTNTVTWHDRTYVAARYLIALPEVDSGKTAP